MGNRNKKRNPKKKHRLKNYNINDRETVNY